MLFTNDEVRKIELTIENNDVMVLQEHCTQVHYSIHTAHRECRPFST